MLAFRGGSTTPGGPWVPGRRRTTKACAAFTLAPVADRIRQDVLILAGTEDHSIPFSQTAAFEKALVNARSVTTRILPSAAAAAASLSV